jgi:hypothetical protein
LGLFELHSLIPFDHLRSRHCQNTNLLFGESHLNGFFDSSLAELFFSVNVNDKISKLTVAGQNAIVI